MNGTRRLPLALLVAALGFGLALPAAAQWKWRDAKGQIQYSDLPPPTSVPAHDILLRPEAAGSARRASPLAGSSSAAPASAAAAAPRLVPKALEPELEARRKVAEQDVADKRKADEARMAAVRGENCNRAKAQQRTLDSGARMARTNEKGEREILDDATRAQEARQTRDAIASNCK